MGGSGVAGKTIAVLGGRGMLGTDLADVLCRRGAEVGVYDLPEFDITDAEMVEEAVRGCDAVVNCAAYTNVDGAETERELAYAVNAEAAGRLGEICRQYGVRVVHISTDFVFDGEKDEPYTEEDEPNPINEYGRSKLAGERMLFEANADACVIRVQWTYGLAGNNFIKKILARARSGAALKVVDDQVGSPTATGEAAKAIADLLGRDELPAGVYHFAAKGYVSRFGAARFVLDKLGLDVELSACKSIDFVTPAKRPLSSRFDCSKIERLLSEPIRNWEGPLAEFLEQLGAADQ